MSIKNQLEIPRETYREIAGVIRSEASPVGIDAVKAHIIIIHKLLEIERRLDDLETGRAPMRNR